MRPEPDVTKRESESDDRLAQTTPPAKSARGLAVVFNSPQSGFMSLGLRFRGQEFTTAVACGPYRSLEDLIGALTALARGEEGAAVVRWNCEPDELDFSFESAGDELRFEVFHYATHAREAEMRQRVFAAAGTRAEVCGEFLHALEELRRDREVDVFESNWRREFPEREFAELARACAARADGPASGGG